MIGEYIKAVMDLQNAQIIKLEDENEKLKNRYTNRDEKFLTERNRLREQLATARNAWMTVSCNVHASAENQRFWDAFHKLVAALFDTPDNDKVLAVVEGHMENAQRISCFHPYSAYQNSFPVTVTVTERKLNE